MEITYRSSIKYLTDYSVTRYEEYKKNIKANIVEEYPNAIVEVIDSDTLEPELNVTYGDQNPSMTVYDHVHAIINKTEY